MSGMNLNTSTGPLPEWVYHIVNQVKRLDYGVVQITVHQGAVSQVDITERRRFPSSGRNGHASSSPTVSHGGGI